MVFTWDGYKLKLDDVQGLEFLYEGTHRAGSVECRNVYSEDFERELGKISLLRLRGQDVVVYADSNFFVSTVMERDGEILGWDLVINAHDAVKHKTFTNYYVLWDDLVGKLFVFKFCRGYLFLHLLSSKKSKFVLVTSSYLKGEVCADLFISQKGKKNSSKEVVKILRMFDFTKCFVFVSADGEIRLNFEVKLEAV